MEMLNRKLVDRVQQSVITPETLNRAVSEYEQERNAYLSTYLTAGFPFGNVDNGYSHSCFYVYRSNWENGHRYDERVRTTYAEEYKKLLDRSMDQLLKNPMDEIRELVKEALENPDLLPRLFPPLCVSTLFSPTDGDCKTFGQRVRLIDQVRKQRNIMVHDGQKVSDTFIEKADSQVTEFARWLTRQ